MPAPLPDEVRAAILADIHTNTLSRNKIAAKHGVATSTVTKIAREAVGDTAFDRSHAEKGARARAFDAKAARATLIAQLYDDAQRFRARAWDPYTQVVSGPTGPELVTTKLPPLRDQQAAYTSLAITVDKALTLEKHDSDEGAVVGKSMVNDLFGALGLAYHRIVAEDEAPTSPDSGPDTMEP
ncbi:hypothetical protein [Salinispora vitiensis]|uniref:hypothetical protein n=1 Tax=Salinispora vitiensis TaxID=999544 RepID=UPI0003818A37|nr:hypothetical protein [Salinispora vitiensis]